jgi:hypothetical protein
MEVELVIKPGGSTFLSSHTQKIRTRIIGGRTMVFPIAFVRHAGFEWPDNRHGALFPTLRLKSKIGADLQPFPVKSKIQLMKNGYLCRIFLLSPAYAGGERARMILSDQGEFELARKLRSKEGAPIADVFTFLSGLYFRGKIAYATVFARPATGIPGVFVITPTRGLVDARTRIHLDDLREFATVDIQSDDPRYRTPIERDARVLAQKLPLRSEIILLGSIATGKYVNVLLATFRDRLRFPVDSSVAGI